MQWVTRGLTLPLFEMRKFCPRGGNEHFSLIWWWMMMVSISSSSAEFLRFKRLYDAQRVARDSVEWRGNYGVKWSSFGLMNATKLKLNSRWWWCFDDLLLLNLAGRWRWEIFKPGVAALQRQTYQSLTGFRIYLFSGRVIGSMTFLPNCFGHWTIQTMQSGGIIGHNP